MSRGTNTDAQNERRRRQVVEGARRCFALHGFHGTGVDDLEQACGLTRGTLFKYYRTKADMLAAVIDAEAGRRESAFQVAMAASAGRSLTDIVRALTAVQLQLSREDPWGLRLRLELRGLAERDRSMRRKVDAIESRLRRGRRKLVAMLAARGLIHPGWNIDSATDAASMLFLGLSAHRAYRLPGSTGDDELAVLTAQMLVMALSYPPAIPSEKFSTTSSPSPTRALRTPVSRGMSPA